MRRTVDRLIGFLCRRILRIFFRRIERVGHRRIPGVEEGPRPPMVVVANHVNGLIDPMFLLGTLRLPARLLGKSTLWKIPLLAQILDLAGVLPVFRRQDEGADTSRNSATFERCHEELARGGVVAIFPEGTSHDEPRLQPLRTGAARIVLEAEARRGPLGSRILPVGLQFEDRGRFRSRALVVVGDALDPAEEIALYADDPVAAVRRLTERVAEALARVTLNYSSWEEARLVERGARILENDDLELPLERRLATEFAARRDLLAGLSALRRTHPAVVSEAVTAARAYDELLSATGLRDEQVVASYPVERIASYLATQLLSGFVALPFALVGALLHLLPFGVVRGIARRVRDEPNQIATYKIFPGIVIYPLWWAGLAWFAGSRGGAPAAIAALLFAPLTGGLALRAFDRWDRLVREGRAFLLLRGRREIAEHLRRLRHEADRRIDALVILWTEQQAFDPDLRRG
ncbi:MAG: 1-acyl-sn-glycerol-3-phosphate acyltransferase [Thermoanaerobaculia bacterium]